MLREQSIWSNHLQVLQRRGCQAFLRKNLEWNPGHVVQVTGWHRTGGTVLLHRLQQSQPCQKYPPKQLTDCQRWVTVSAVRWNVATKGEASELTICKRKWVGFSAYYWGQRDQCPPSSLVVSDRNQLKLNIKEEVEVLQGIRSISHSCNSKFLVER